MVLVHSPIVGFQVAPGRAGWRFLPCGLSSLRWQNCRHPMERSTRTSESASVRIWPVRRQIWRCLWNGFSSVAERQTTKAVGDIVVFIPFQLASLNCFPRYAPVQLVPMEPQRMSGWRGCPTHGGISPLNSVPIAEPQQMRQVGEVAQLRRYLPAQPVIAEIQPLVRLVRLPNCGGISPCKSPPGRGTDVPAWLVWPARPVSSHSCD